MHIHIYIYIYMHIYMYIVPVPLGPLPRNQAGGRPGRHPSGERKLPPAQPGIQEFLS